MWNAVKRPWQAITSNEKPKLDADDPLKNEKETQPDTPGNEYTSQQQHRPEEDENNKATVAQDSFIEGPRLVFLTIGLMALVLMVALDNYILGVYYVCITSVAILTTDFSSQPRQFLEYRPNSRVSTLSAGMQAPTSLRKWPFNRSLDTCSPIFQSGPSRSPPWQYSRSAQSSVRQPRRLQL